MFFRLEGKRLNSKTQNHKFSMDQNLIITTKTKVFYNKRQTKYSLSVYGLNTPGLSVRPFNTLI